MRDRKTTSSRIFRKRGSGSVREEEEEVSYEGQQDPSFPPSTAISNVNTPFGSHDDPYLTTGQQTPTGGYSPSFLQARQHALSIMSKHTFQEGRKQQLICNLQEEDDETPLLQIVALKVTKGDYVYWPRKHERTFDFISSLCQLNVGSAVTLATTVTEGIVNMIPPGAPEVAISPSLHIQVLRDSKGLANARKAQGAAFLLLEKCVVVWADEPIDLLTDAQNIHEELAEFLWAVAGSATPRHRDSTKASVMTPRLECAQSPAPSIHGHGSFPGLHSFNSGLSGAGSTSSSRDINGDSPNMNHSESRGQLVLAQDSYNDEKATELEGGVTNTGLEEERPTMILSAITHGLACALALLVSTLQVRDALAASLLDGQWLRMAIAVVSPFYFFLLQFFCDNIMSALFMLFGPVRQLHTNSRYYSGVRPKPMRSGPLPHITIQMPVYKEDFDFVLKPSFESIKKAIRTYELQGGSASIIVSEDGMVLLDPVEREARLTYYEDNNITWVARPKHGKDGFIREGRFKKASNLNFTYDVLLRTEALFDEAKSRYTPTSMEEQANEMKQLYDTCLNQVLKQIHPDARGSGIDKFGDYILLIDSDTRVPVDCFLDAATEMTQSPEVGILQHCSGVMIVSTSFFERCIAFFTRLVNFSISYAIANGDVAPFMGHNAYLRWSAMKEIGKTVTLPDGREQLKIWSEDHVSEDFVMALDMIERGYTVRWATYSNSEYMEGVSLTCDDELNRWQKYAWGVSEMIFNPFRLWYRGPITPLFRRFLWGNAPIHYKWASCSYCFSYYAIGLAIILTAGMTLVQGWLGTEAQAPYIPTFQVLIACLVVFTGVGTIALCIVRFRAGYGNLFSLLGENIVHLPFLIAFFSGLSYHVSTALLSHLIGINMTWGATLKDIEMSNFFVEAPQILKRHYRLLIICSLMLGGMAVLTTDLVPLMWRVDGIYVVFPFFLLYSLHILFPIILNPNLVRFSF